MRTLILTLLIYTSCSSVGFAQNQKEITGHVYYEDTKEPIPFAYVKIRGVAFGTVTDFDGSFKLTLPAAYFDKTLDFSYMGFKDQPFDLSQYDKPIQIYMKADIKQLYAVIITGKRTPNPKNILRKVVAKIPDNYINQDYQLDGFYREHVSEYGQPVKYADASFQLNLNAHAGEVKKSKAFEKPDDPSNANTIGSWASKASSLHRWHFHQKVLKSETARIIESKASDDLNTTGLVANIQGGPLSAITKDRIKYPTNFMTDLGRYEYELVDVLHNEEEHYLITFEPSKPPILTEEDLTEPPINDFRQFMKNLRKVGRATKNKYKLAGTILIRKEDLAVVELSYSVPPSFKQEICGYRNWSVRHFDFKVTARYKQTQLGYVLDYLKHEDEFIVEDTINEARVPYAAISELFVHQAQEITQRIASDDNFSNSDYNHLFDYPDGYNVTFWKNYEARYPHAVVPEDIRTSMGAVKPVVRQFADKLLADSTLQPPIAPVSDYRYSIHNQIIQDEYAWLKDTLNPRGNEQIMQYLAAENRYTDNYYKPLKNLRKEITQELRAQIQEDYESLPVTENGYSYYFRYVRDQQYPTYYRKDTTSGSIEEVLFDVNVLAKDNSYFSISGIQISPNTRLAAYQENTTGTDQWTLRFKNLVSGKLLSDSIHNIGQMAWLNDEVVYYTTMNPKTFRSATLFRYQLGSNQPQLIHAEEDPLFSYSLGKSRSKEILKLTSSSSNEDEIRFLKIDDPEEKWKTVTPRRSGHKYQVTHANDQLFIISNHKAINNCVSTTDIAKYEESNWTEIRSEDKEVHILSMLPFAKYRVYQERHGLDYKLKVEEIQSGKSHYIKQDGMEALSIGNNTDFDTDTLQFVRNSYFYPITIMNYHMGTKKQVHIKYIGKFLLLGKIKQERTYATSKDGTEIPITLIYRKNKVNQLMKEGKTPPLYITGYGAYGSSNTPSYDPGISPLIANGGVYAIAHVRGGGDLGQAWYDAGKMLHKKNTFSDFISCTEFLIKSGYGQKGQVIAEGGSAGGLLVGAIANERPDLFGMIILDVPFVDVVNTMLDDKLPLTTGEYLEWGNPNEKKYFEYIKSYSPYDNIKKQDYPAMLFMTGINDTRVNYWEPAKMVARLRKMNTGNREILLYTDFSSGHGGGSGRYEQIARRAFKQSFAVNYMKINE